MCFAVNLGVAVELELAAMNLRFAAETKFLQRISIRCRNVCFAANLGVATEVELVAANLGFAAETEFPVVN